MIELNQAVQQAIRDNLPGTVAEELKTFITRAQRTEEQLRTAERQIDSLQTELNTATKKIVEQREIDEKLKRIAEQQEELQKRELQLIRDTAMNRALVAEKGLEVGMEVMSMVFRNTSVRERIHGTIPVAVEGSPPSQYNNMGTAGYVVPSQTDTTKETTKE